ncbi:TetR/AcrR family transcriptional regulator [Nocardia callitridis]|uniref:TetR/AcrR family transcriptional regulator n=1 Tax=Nocardia callitridis TaxID=648753 RepID=UPI0031E686DE
MTSTSPTSPSAGEAEPGSLESRILDAALDQFGLVGIKKTTIEDIARRAGVDRVTVYRRVGSRDDVVKMVTTREVGRALAALQDIPDRHDDLADLVTDILRTVYTLWRTHPLVTRMLDVEPDRVLPQLTTEGAPVFAMCVFTATEVLRRAVDKDLLPDSPDLPARVEIMCRVVHSLILQPHGAIPSETDAELDTFARTYLVPILRG